MQETRSANPQSAIRNPQSPDTWPLAPAYRVPARPLVTLEAAGRRPRLDLRGLWAYREVFFFLTWRDVKVRYKQTAFGVAWALFQPLALMLSFTFFFGFLARVPSDGIPYPIFIYAAVMPWTFFSNALNAAGNSLTGNANLITKVYFPRLLIPAAAVGAGLVDFAVAFLLLLFFMPYYEIGLTWNALLYPVMIVLVTVLALGLGLWMAALNAKYRDVRHALPFLLQVWMFATPVIYPLSLVPDEYRWLLRLNPMTGLIEGFRSALFGRPFDWPALGWAAGFAVVALVYFAYTFRRMEDDFADVI